MYQAAFNFHVYLITILVSVAITGDYTVYYSNLYIYRAIFDNITHALIGGISWLIVCIEHKNRYSTQTLFEICLCTIISSCIDLDHFLAARSLSLKDATSLKFRAPLHCTTVPLVIVFVLISISYVQQEKWLLKISFITLTAFISHHTRDATRRGFWLYPFGSSPPIPYVVYIIMTISIPYVVCLLMKFIQIEKIQNQTVTV